MNVSFHTLTALAVASAMSSRKRFANSAQPFISSDVPFLAVGFAIGVFSHGLLDVTPHAYPIKAVADVFLGLIVFVSAFIFAKTRNRLLVAACFAGCVFPDLVDLGPAILNKHLGCSLPVVKVFPWHWLRFSGSIYDGSRPMVSLLAHLMVVVASLGILCAFRKSLFAWEPRSL
jgi:hypothetical protein